MSALRDSLRLLAMARHRALPPMPRNQRPRKPRGGGAAAPLPVTPDRPRNLSGGAAAALEYDA